MLLKVVLIYFILHFNDATKKLKIIYVTYIIFLLDNTTTVGFHLFVLLLVIYLFAFVSY